VERHARDDADVQLLTDRVKLLFRRLLEDVVDYLDGVDMALAQCLDGVPRLVIVEREAKIANLALFAQLQQRVDPFAFIGPVVVPDVELLEVDRLDAEVPQALLRAFYYVIVGENLT